VTAGKNKLENSIKDRVIYIMKHIDEDLTEKTISNLEAMLKKDDKKPIKIVISSPGGCAYSGLAIYDAIRNSPVPMEITATGLVASAGLFIYLAGDIRKATSNVTFMSHLSSSETFGKTFEMQIDVKESVRLDKLFLKLLEERTEISWKNRLKYKDFYFNYKIGKKLGVINA